MADTAFPLQIISPARVVFSGEATLAQIPGLEGDFGVLAGHAPFFSIIRPGVITVEGAQGTKRYFATGGYADVSPTGTTVLSDHIRDLSEVTAEEAATALDAAQAALNLAETEAEKKAAAKQQLVAEALASAVRPH